MVFYVYLAVRNERNSSERPLKIVLTYKHAEFLTRAVGEI
jgi:hypothetical protein